MGEVHARTTQGLSRTLGQEDVSTQRLRLVAGQDMGGGWRQSLGLGQRRQGQAALQVHQKALHLHLEVGSRLVLGRRRERRGVMLLLLLLQVVLMVLVMR